MTKRLGQRLHSRAAAGEGTQNLICAAQAAVVLVGLIVIGIWPGGWPAAPVVALGIAAWSAWEGGKSWRGSGCCQQVPDHRCKGTDRYHQNADQAADQRIREIKLNPAPWYQASCSLSGLVSPRLLGWRRTTGGRSRIRRASGASCRAR